MVLLMILLMIAGCNSNYRFTYSRHCELAKQSRINPMYSALLDCFVPRNDGEILHP